MYKKELELDIKKIDLKTKKCMLSSLIKNNMYYECKELCYVFIKYIEDNSVINLLLEIINECSGLRRKEEVLKKIEEW